MILWTCWIIIDKQALSIYKLLNTVLGTTDKTEPDTVSSHTGPDREGDRK